MRQAVGWAVGMAMVALGAGCDFSESGTGSKAAYQSTNLAQGAGTDRRSVDGRPEFLGDERLPNAYRLHEKVISGGLPEEPGMRALQELGVKTIISVDGAQPNVELAKKFGLRYVHLPHGYDGIPEVRAQELAKAVLELEGPVYIHCHHGKHRSPAAAAVACIGAGLISAESGLTTLKAAGTSESYRGLYQSVTAMHPLDRALLDKIQVDFKEAVPVPPLAEAMVALEHVHDHLQLLARNNWQTSVEHPDIDAAHEALLLMENFRELLRTDEVRAKPKEFQSILSHSAEVARQLESTLRLNREAALPGNRVATATTLLKLVTADCKTCHESYRDRPLTEKGSGSK